MKKKQNTKKVQEASKVGIILTIVIALIAVIGVTYAIFQYQKLGTKKNTITTGTLILTLDESQGNAISLTNAVPMSDTQGKALTPYHFVLKNTGTLPAKYRIRLESDTAAINTDKCSSKLMTTSQVKYALTKNSTAKTPALLSTLSSHVLDTGTLAANGTITYDLRLWIASTVGTEVNGKHFHVKLYVDGIVDGHTDWTTGK